MLYTKKRLCSLQKQAVKLYSDKDQPQTTTDRSTQTSQDSATQKQISFQQNQISSLNPISECYALSMEAI